jgi:hypothetical protein
LRQLTLGGGVKHADIFGTEAWAASSGAAGNDAVGTTLLDRNQSSREKLKKLINHVIQYDLGDLVYRLKAGTDVTMPDAAMYDVNPADLFLDEKVHLLDADQWSNASPDDARVWQQFVNFNKHVPQYERDNSTFLYTVLREFMTVDLRERVDAEFNRSFSLSQQGGITYLYTFMFTIFGSSSLLTDSIKEKLAKFADQGTLLFNGQNILHLAEEVSRWIKYLGREGELTPKMITQVVKGLSKCQCPAFSQHFEQVGYEETKSRLHATHSMSGIDKGVRSQESICARICEILRTAATFYTSLNTDGLWRDNGDKELKLYTASGSITFKGNCFNCGGKHRLDDCPVRRDEAKIKANKEAFQKSKVGSTRGGGSKGSPSLKSDIPTRDSGSAVSGRGSGKSHHRNYKIVGETVVALQRVCQERCARVGQSWYRPPRQGDDYSGFQHVQ